MVDLIDEKKLPIKYVILFASMECLQNICLVVGTGMCPAQLTVLFLQVYNIYKMINK